MSALTGFDGVVPAWMICSVISDCLAVGTLAAG
jgi:hypothetical protein